MNRPKVSVIMPVYNTAPYLNESIGSILNQTLEELELWIVDDGSTDNSLEIIKEFAGQDNRVHWISQQNNGQSVARNVALHEVLGEYIYFMDSDDILKEDALRIGYEYICEYNSDVVFFDGEIINEKGSSPICWDYHRTSRYKEHQLYNGQELLDDMLDNHTFRAVPWLYLVRRKYVNNIKITFYPGIIHEDELFTFLLFLQSDKIVCLQKSLINHRIRNSSTMGIKYSMRNVDCYFTIFKELIIFKANNLYSAIVNKYISYTINGVIQTAYSLSYRDKFIIMYRCIINDYIRYLHFINAIKLYFKFK